MRVFFVDFTLPDARRLEYIRVLTGDWRPETIAHMLTVDNLKIHERDGDFMLWPSRLGLIYPRPEDFAHANETWDRLASASELEDYFQQNGILLAASSSPMGFLSDITIARRRRVGDNGAKLAADWKPNVWEG